MPRSASSDPILLPADGYAAMFQDAPPPTAEDLRGLPSATACALYIVQDTGPDPASASSPDLRARPAA